MSKPVITLKYRKEIKYMIKAIENIPYYIGY